MSSKPSERTPTESELKILRVVWEHGSVSVREVYEDLCEREDIGHTTVLKLMQIMVEKGILERDTSVRPQVFWAARPQRQMQRMLLRQLVDRAFSGSPGSLVLQALSLRKSKPEELEEIRALLDELERKQQEN